MEKLGSSHFNKLFYSRFQQHRDKLKDERKERKRQKKREKKKRKKRKKRQRKVSTDRYVKLACSWSYWRTSFSDEASIVNHL